VPPISLLAEKFLYPRRVLQYFTMSNVIFNCNFLALVLSEILGGLKFTLGALRPLDAPSGEIFVPKKSEYFTISNCVSDFSYLALVHSEILGGSQIYIRGPCASQRSPSGKILTSAQVLVYIYIIVNFQLRSSIHAGLTERSLCNRFCIERSAKMGFWGEGLRYLVGSS